MLHGMSSQPLTHTADRAAARPGLLRAAAETAGAALVANLVILAVASAVVDVPDRFTPLQPGSVVFMTILGVALAAGLLRVVPDAATFRKAVIAGFVLSLVPDALIWANGAYEGAAKAETVLPLMLMHAAAATAVATILPRRPEPAPA